MSAIASEPANKHILHVADFSNLDDIIKDLSVAICREFLYVSFGGRNRKRSQLITHINFILNN